MVVLAISSVIFYIASLNSSSFANLFIGALSTGATIVVAVSIRQLELGVRHLRLDTLNFVYQLLDRDSFKQEIHDLIRQISSEIQSISIKEPKEKESSKEEEEEEERLLKEEERLLKVAKISATFDRVGYFVYKGYLEAEYIADLFGFLILRSFLAFKPYLEKLRYREEGPDGPWFFRRYYLLLVVTLEKVLYENPDFRPLLENLYKKWNQPTPEKPSKLPAIVPQEWLSREVRGWLKRNGFT
ncbi:DUF4760 domain-containing protein [Thermus sp.]|uniref:DUF4760 domain-containing protein n=1 Tax=Thermus sp. TaxID=275 RepID=UPI003D0B4F0D